MKKLQFPDGFLWGASTAAYQVEGGIENVDWAKAAREGKVPVCGLACDHFNRFKQDIALAKNLGHNVHRFSVEWARIEPTEGEFSKEAIEHYREVLRELRTHNIRPMITLWHFTLPLWFSERGGFAHKDAPNIFARYCAFVAQELCDLCEDFATINEPMVYAGLGFIRGVWPPFLTRAFFSYVSVVRALIRSHNLAYAAIKAVAPQTNVSLVKHTIYFFANNNPFNKLRAYIANYLWSHYFLSRTISSCDSLGLNYYQHKKFGDTETYEKTDMGWNIYPEGMYGALKLLAKYQKPIMVTEAGIADADDSHRALYIKKQIIGVHKALAEGVDVRGHCYWSLLDNYEWAEGFDKRFGLIEVNFQTQERTIRPSALLYKVVCEQNAITVE